MAKKRKSGGGIADFFSFIVAAAIFFGIFIANDSNDITDIVDISKKKSQEVSECYNGKECVDGTLDLSDTGKTLDIDLPKNLGDNVKYPNLDGKQIKFPNLGEKKVQTPNIDGNVNYSDFNLDSSSISKDKLNGLIIEEAKNVDYDRKEWKHWISTDRGCWNVREDVLFRDASSIEMLDNNKKPTENKELACNVVGGKWTDFYSGKEVNDPKKIDIDHIIPLGYVAKHGGQEWSKEEKERYANDPEVLLAVSASENRSKSDKGPSEYMPPNESFRCDYSKMFINVADKYTISITAQDKKALNDGLRTCTN